MNLKQLTLPERVSLIGSRILSVSSRVNNLDPRDATESDLEEIGKDLNRIIDLIEESDPTLTVVSGRSN